MKLRYSYGIVSFCPDLTSGKARSIPVGALLVGNLSDAEVPSDAGVAAVLVPTLEIGCALDPITHEVLMSVADLLRLHVSEVISSDPQASPKEIVSRLHDKLRNSLFVAEISSEQTVDLTSRLSISQLLERAYEDAIAKAGWIEVPVQSSATKIPEVDSMYRFERPPTTAISA